MRKLLLLCILYTSCNCMINAASNTYSNFAEKYAEVFGENPPSDIWQAQKAESCDADDCGYVDCKVDTTTN